jgi:hypothetical protein
VDISLSQFFNWKLNQQFAGRVAEIQKKLGDVALRYAIARKSRRIRYLDERRGKMEQIVAERAAAPEMRDAPGGKTGLLVRTFKGVGSGPAARVVEEFAVDTALLKEMRETEKQAAIEAGQWSEKHEHSGGLNFNLEISYVSDFYCLPEKADTPAGAAGAPAAGAAGPGPV